MQPYQVVFLVEAIIASTFARYTGKSIYTTIEFIMLAVANIILPPTATYAVFAFSKVLVALSIFLIRKTNDDKTRLKLELFGYPLFALIPDTNPLHTKELAKNSVVWVLFECIC